MLRQVLIAIPIAIAGWIGGEFAKRVIAKLLKGPFRKLEETADQAGDKLDAALA